MPRKPKIAKTTLTIKVTYDPRKTDPEGLAVALDNIIETGLTALTFSALGEYGHPNFGKVYVERPIELVCEVEGGVLNDVRHAHPDKDQRPLGYYLVDHDVMEECDCRRCGSAVDDAGHCVDATCPFHEHSQLCPRGWSGHPDRDPHYRDDTCQLPCVCGEEEHRVEEEDDEADSADPKPGDGPAADQDVPE